MKANDLSQFSFKKTGYGCYYVTYTSPNGRYYWGYTINDMGIIDDTLNADHAGNGDESIKPYNYDCAHGILLGVVKMLQIGGEK